MMDKAQIKEHSKFLKQEKRKDKKAAQERKRNKHKGFIVSPILH